MHFLLRVCVVLGSSEGKIWKTFLLVWLIRSIVRKMGSKRKYSEK